MTKKRVLITTVREGHKSIANAIEALLSQQYQVKQTPDNYFDILFRPYSKSIQFFPYIMYIPFFLAKNEYFNKLSRQAFKKTAYQKTLKDVLSFQPHCIISTYFGFNEALNQICKAKKIPWFNIVTDPRIAHSNLLDKKTLNLVFDQELSDTAQHAYNIAKDKLLVSGWFVHPKFYQHDSSEQMWRFFDFNPKVFTILICGGSEGMSAILKILPAFINSPKPVQVIIVCGKNKILARLIKQFLRSTKSLLPQSHNANIKVLGFTTKMPELMSMANLVVGKAGPNLLFEAVASQKPFLAISHMPGQEEPNLKLIKDLKLGFVEENPLKTIPLLHKIITYPRILKRFSQGITKIRNHNQKSAQVLQTYLKQKLG
ncbi:hypothetical protein GYA49_05940 [Candidatus Beckwithbacteria bacterium]|nr:hypothetical protein [Candidatus Beckwithbacteria bacterium]